MRVKYFAYTLLVVGLTGHTTFAQVTDKALDKPPDTTLLAEKPKLKEVDVIDLMAMVVKGNSLEKHNTKPTKTGRLHISVAPGIGYTLSTGFAGIIASNTAFYTSENDDAKLSNIFADVVYTQKEQLITHIQGTIWTKNNGYNIVTDWRYLKYPQQTFGLGTNSSLNNAFDQDYNYIRLYQTVLKNVGYNLYAGIGYSLDYHWNISETAADGIQGVSDAQIYGLNEKSVSSGINFNVLYDSRDNSINPDGGTYVNVLFRPNLKAMGSDSDWESLKIEIRKYYHFPRNSENILAFWNFNWLTVAGNSPYLDLPSTGWDPYNNLGRGYIQGRFRGKNMIYFESEYRFKIMNNGLIGGVVFANAQSFTEWPSNNFESIAPAAGLGMRVKFNKHSRTNIAIDYGFGSGGSRGFFLNLGEVF